MPDISDQQHLDEIKRAQKELCAFIDRALDAGLKIECRVDATDTYSAYQIPGRNTQRVRCIDATARRDLK